MTCRYCLAICCLLLVFVLTPGDPRPAAAQDTSVDPPAAEPGTRFRFGAGGFLPGEEISFWINLPDGNLLGNAAYVENADEEGVARWEWSVPRRTPPGVLGMNVLGRESGLFHAIPFEVVFDPDQGAIPLVSVAPIVGEPGFTFSFFARAFDDEEEVGYWFNGPDGTLISDGSFRETSDDGEVEWTWTAPEDVQIGFWSVVVRGEDSNNERVIRFEIAAPTPTPTPEGDG